MRRVALGAILVLGATVAPATAAPLCPRPAPHLAARPANSFARSPRPQPIAPGEGRCGWGLGLATGPTGTGTAFIVGHRREVMTNLHVVDSGCRGNRRFTFAHGFAGGRALSSQTATVVATGDYCRELGRGRHDYGGDWAVAVLRSDPVALEPAAPAAAVLPLAPHTGGSWRQDNGRYYLLGYSMSFRAGEQPFSAGPCRLGPLFAAGVVEHDCAAGRRSSGAPILSQGSSGQCLVAAIHVGEIEDLGGHPSYRADVNANVAVLATGFAGAVDAVARALWQGRSAGAIARDLAAGLPERR